jgi:hypothetical protein
MANIHSAMTPEPIFAAVAKFRRLNTATTVENTTSGTPRTRLNR